MAERAAVSAAASGQRTGVDALDGRAGNDSAAVSELAPLCEGENFISFTTRSFFFLSVPTFGLLEPSLTRGPLGGADLVGKQRRASRGVLVQQRRTAAARRVSRGAVGALAVSPAGPTPAGA